MIKVGVVGGSGYTGMELLRLLARHDGADIRVVTSRRHAGMPVADLCPGLRGWIDLSFSAPEIARLQECDLVFFATPDGVAMTQARELLAAGVKVIDLSSDHCIRDAAEWAKWHGTAHACPSVLAEAVYGMPEINRAQIRSASLLANPTGEAAVVQLGFLPLIETGVIDPASLIADCKSGLSAAGRAADRFAEADDTINAYGLAGHRCLAEIRQGLARAAGQAIGLTFVPHRVPMFRGIHATLYARLAREVDLQTLFEDRYAAEAFVDVLPAGSYPETRSVRGTNTCRIAVHRPQDGDTVIVLAVIDNLVKGAAGQAVQNMNILFGLPESQGLDFVPLQS